MKDSPQVLRARLRWVKLYEETTGGLLVCRRCGISRPTLRKWWRRYQAEGEAGLYSRSHRPHNIKRKVTEEHLAWIRHLRLERKLGPHRIQAELVRLHGFHLAAPGDLDDPAPERLALAQAAQGARPPEALCEGGARRSGPDRHGEGGQGALPVHRHRRLHAHAGASAFSEAGCEDVGALPA